MDDLDIQLKKLDDELDTYSFNVQHIDDEERQEIKELYKMFYSVHSKRIYLDNVNKKNIKITNQLFIDDSKINKYPVKKSNSIFMDGCKKSTVNINRQINHLTLHNCHNITLHIGGNIVSGMDIINCRNITFDFIDSTFNYADCSKTDNCSFRMIAPTIKDLIVSVCATNDVSFTTDEDNDFINYNLDVTLFDIYRIFKLSKEDEQCSISLI